MPAEARGFTCLHASKHTCEIYVKHDGTHDRQAGCTLSVQRCAVTVAQTKLFPEHFRDPWVKRCE